MTAENNYGFSENWKVSEKKPGYMVKTIVVGNVTVDILRPILTPEERAKREDRMMTNIANIMAPHLRKERTSSNDEDEKPA